MRTEDVLALALKPREPAIGAAWRRRRGAMSVAAKPAAGYGSGDKDKRTAHPCLTRRGGASRFIVGPRSAFVGRGRRWLEPER